MINFLRISLLIILLAAITYPSTGQGGRPKYNGKVTGKVLDKETGKPLPYTTISLLYRDTIVVTGAITDKDGLFTVENVPPVQYRLKAHFIGYKPFFKEGINMAGRTKLDVGEIHLSANIVETEGVKVEAEKDIVSYEIDKKVINLKESDAAKGATAAEALEKVPSVRMDIDGNIYLRGSQNFTLLVDGKPTMMSAKDLLQQLPAESLQSIEIITNPSAKYDPDGVSGILNLITKSDELSGFSGLLNMTSATRDKYSASLNSNYRNSVYSTNMAFSYNSRRMHPVSDFMRETVTNDTTFLVKSLMNRTYFSKGYNLRGGGDYYINDNNTLQLQVDYGYFGFDRIMPTEYSEWNSFNEDRSYFKNDDLYIVDGNYISSYLNYEINLNDAGQKISTNFLYSYWQADAEGSSARSESNQGHSEIVDLLRKNKSATEADGTNLRYKIDYTLPFEEIGKIEAGAQSDYFVKGSDFIYQDFDTSQEVWNINNNYSNESDYDHYINSLYLTYTDQIIEDLGFMVGLRGEHFQRNLHQITTGQDFDFDQFNLFPSAHLTWTMSQVRQLQASYSRRVYRPDHRQLNPYPDFVDEYYISQGNPNLKPQFTDSYELNYRDGFGKFFISLETYYRQTNNLIGRTMTLLPDNRILLTSDNNDKDYLYGGEISVNATPFDWLRFYVAGNYYSYNLVEKDDFGGTDTRQTNVADLNGMATVYFSKSTVLQLNGYYSGPRIITDGEQEEVFIMSASIRQDFFNRSLSLLFNVRDIFSTGDYVFDNRTLNLHSYGGFTPEQPVASLTLTYRINNYQSDRRGQDGQAPDTNFEGGI